MPSNMNDPEWRTTSPIRTDLRADAAPWVSRATVPPATGHPAADLRSRLRALAEPFRPPSAAPPLRSETVLAPPASRLHYAPPPGHFAQRGAIRRPFAALPQYAHPPAGLPRAPPLVSPPPHHVDAAAKLSLALLDHPTAGGDNHPSKPEDDGLSQPDLVLLPQALRTLRASLAASSSSSLADGVAGPKPAVSNPTATNSSTPAAGTLLFDGIAIMAAKRRRQGREPAPTQTPPPPARSTHAGPSLAAHGPLTGCESMLQPLTSTRSESSSLAVGTEAMPSPPVAAMTSSRTPGGGVAGRSPAVSESGLHALVQSALNDNAPLRSALSAGAAALLSGASRRSASATSTASSYDAATPMTTAAAAASMAGASADFTTITADLNALLLE